MKKPVNRFNQGAIDQYTAFLGEYGDFIAALSWGQFQQYGKGLVNIEVNNGRLRLSFWRLENLSSRTGSMVERCDFSTDVVARFPDGVVVNFTPALPPPLAYATITPQRWDFMVRSSSDFRW